MLDATEQEKILTPSKHYKVLDYKVLFKVLTKRSFASIVSRIFSFEPQNVTSKHIKDNPTDVEIKAWESRNKKYFTSKYFKKIKGKVCLIAAIVLKYFWKACTVEL